MESEGRRSPFFPPHFDNFYLFVDDPLARANKVKQGGLHPFLHRLSKGAMDNSPPPFQPGFFRGSTHHFRLRVYFEDTDLSGIVYHANYIRYMERARSDMLRLASIDQRAAMEAGEGAWAITDLALKYRMPAKLEDDLEVISTVDAVRGASVIISQIIMRGQQPLTEGRVTAAFLSPEGRPRRQPADWAARFTAIMNGETFPC
jgi:acyl-CoA thioester hydrolase